VVRYLVREIGCSVLNLDKLTYAGHLSSLRDVESFPNYRFVKMDICDPAFAALLTEFQPDGILHLAAESHVDRSIDAPLEFVQTNVLGTANLLQCTLHYFKTLSKERQAGFRFQHVSTDEVYGSLGVTGLFREESPYAPHSPYAASKAGADHLVRAWGHTYGLPVVLSNCSNNYGPYQFPEKLIPLVILNALEGKKLPIYGKGDNVRDWLYVDDHAKALWVVHEKGVLGETYNIGGSNERTNVEIVLAICHVLDELRPKAGVYADQIEFVADRPGHDKRYAIDAEKLKTQLHWTPEQTFDAGLRLTVQWYLENEWWWRPVISNQ